MFSSPSESFIATLKVIHAVGILHGHILPRYLLINDAGETTIINFAHSTINPPPRRLEAETRELSELLLQLESTRTSQVTEARIQY